MGRKNDQDHYAQLAIKIASYDVAVGESINIHLLTHIPHLWDDSDPVIAPDFRLVVAGSCTYPKHRAGDAYEFTLYGEKLLRERLNFKDIRVLDKNNAPVYRKYRGGLYPAFTVPSGLATIQRSRGTREWKSALFVDPSTINRMLAVLNLERELYASIDEHLIDRKRWVRGFSVQTIDPANE